MLAAFGWMKTWGVRWCLANPAPQSCHFPVCMGPPSPLRVRLPDDPENLCLNCCGNIVHVPLEIKSESHARTGYPHSRHGHAPIRTPLSAALSVPLQLHVSWYEHPIHSNLKFKQEQARQCWHILLTWLIWRPLSSFQYFVKNMTC